jgi:hypothetical protein
MKRFVAVIFLLCCAARFGLSDEPRTYQLTLKKLKDPQPLLADYPEFIQPIEEATRYEAPIVVDDEGADLSVRAWRFSYNARGIIEFPNRLKAKDTAVILVHPWGIDDEQGWKTPEPAGVCDFCTPAKNAIGGKHTREVIDPFLKTMRDRVGVVAMSLIGDADPIRTKLYRSIDYKPTKDERAAAKKQLAAKLNSFKYKAGDLPKTIKLSKDRPVIDFIKQFNGLMPDDHFNGPGFWKLPVPVTSDVEVFEDDVVVYDPDGYPKFRDFLKKQGIRHVLLTGYATDMCFCKTTAGYENLSKDFNVFLVGDASLATFPANSTPKYATNAAISFASIDQLVTQISWVKLDEK